MNRTEALRQALERVWSGAESVDAECVEDALYDLGFEVVAQPKRMKALEQDPLPLAASTRGLPKMAAP